MRLLEKFERSIEQLVEGIPQAVFRQKLQPAELGRKLEREMLQRKQAGFGSPLVPNQFDVYLNPSDYEPFGDIARTLEGQMASWLTQVAHRKGCHVAGKVNVSMHQSNDIAKRKPRIVSRFTEQVRRVPEKDGHTGVIPSAGASASLTGSLTLLDGPERGRTFIVPDGATTIGRSPDNDVVIDHPDVSRRHARIDCSSGGIRIHDLGSTNGTRVNGDAVSVADLAQSDMIQVGSVRLKVAVHSSRRPA